MLGGGFEELIGGLVIKAVLAAFLVGAAVVGGSMWLYQNVDVDISVRTDQR